MNPWMSDRSNAAVNTVATSGGINGRDLDL